MRPLLARTLIQVGAEQPTWVYDETAGVSRSPLGTTIAEGSSRLGTLTKTSPDPADPADLWLRTVTKVGGPDVDAPGLVWVDGETRTSPDWPDPTPGPRAAALRDRIATKTSPDVPDPDPAPLPPRDNLATGVVAF
jgi:hypothetical protein